MLLFLKRLSELCQKEAAVPADILATRFAAQLEADNRKLFRGVADMLVAQEVNEVIAEATGRQQSPAVLAFSQLWWRNAGHLHGSCLRCLSLPTSEAAMSTSCLQTSARWLAT